MTNGFRARADALGSDRPSGGFHSKSSFEAAPATARIVAQAVARAKQGDKEAVRFLYLQYADNVYGYVRSIVRDEYEAEDVTQHVFGKLMTVIVKYDQQGVPFIGWLLRLSHNVAIDHLRSRRAIPCEEVRELYPQSDDDESSRNRSLMLREALATLPDEQRRVIVLRHVVGLSPGEIASEMGRTEPSIHGLHHRGRGALRAVLSEMECEPTVGAQVAA
jgi:RNA polymerase sigma-70 factor, ECF subfamily